MTLREAQWLGGRVEASLVRASPEIMCYVVEQETLSSASIQKTSQRDCKKLTGT